MGRLIKDLLSEAKFRPVRGGQAASVSSRLMGFINQLSWLPLVKGAVTALSVTEGLLLSACLVSSPASAATPSISLSQSTNTVSVSIPTGGGIGVGGHTLTVNTTGAIKGYDVTLASNSNDSNAMVDSKDDGTVNNVNKTIPSIVGSNKQLTNGTYGYTLGTLANAETNKDTAIWNEVPLANNPVNIKHSNKQTTQDQTQADPVDIAYGVNLTGVPSGNYKRGIQYTATATPRPTYTVTFNTDGGSAVASQQVLEGDKAAKPTTDPTKSGYTFDGWYSDSGLTKSYDFNSTVNSAITIYAKWTSASLIAPGKSLADYTWEELSKITASSKVTTNEIEGMCLGGLHRVVWNGTRYDVRCIGVDQEELASSRNHSITFQFDDVVLTRYMINGADTQQWSFGYGKSEMNEYLNGNFVSLIDNTVAQLLQTASKEWNAAGGSKIKGRSKMFLPSVHEIFGEIRSNTGIFNYGIWYTWYKNGGTTLKRYNDKQISWWLRDVDESNTNWFQCANGSQGICNGTAVIGVAPCFII